MQSRTKELLLQRIRALDNIPALPSLALLLLHYADTPIANVMLPWVVELISQDSIAADSCLKMANSALSRSRSINTVHEAVMALGLSQVRDLTISCLGKAIALDTSNQLLDPLVFWRHSLGCALVSKWLARRVDCVDEERAYFCGLFHDLGVIVHWWLIPDELKLVLQCARSERISLHQAELKVLGIAHTESGSIAAQRWRLGLDVIDTISFHHSANSAPAHRELVAIVTLSDSLCLNSNLGYGLNEAPSETAINSAIAALKEQLLSTKGFDWTLTGNEAKSYVEKVKRSVFGGR